ncbi:amino acid ABC transporter permease [Collinsella sp. AGMB00827]|uniref:Amino acid ABC transporter permease n=1 Tax=Collinsella ureilytica TaxID=2869515 RepID=A0ABS7MIE7_9ACTN|nr:amino acid ABC transporter permease [Collinsella urealyticum]MBY4797146.1 amino acid ABC transporter permease [Collinsella urealyticum]
MSQAGEAPRSIRDALYEEPGPKMRRRIRIGTAGAAVVVAALAVLIVRQFWITGQLDEGYWAFFTWPSTWAFLFSGFRGTLSVSLVAAAIALVLGFLLMLGRISAPRPIAAICRVATDFFRGVPSLLLIYFFFLVVPQYGIKLPAFWMITLPVALGASGVLAEVLRAGINAVPAGQTEAALSIGMRPFRALMLIVVPQGVRYVIPSLISQLVVVVKDTTLAYVVSYPDLLQNGRVLITNYDALVSTYFVIAVIYILLNYAINHVAVTMARRSGQERADDLAASAL